MTAVLLALELGLSALSGPSVQPPAGRQNAPVLVKGDSKARKSKYQPYALLYGTVFDEGGYLVRGAQIEVRARQPAEAGRRHTERWESRSDSQGEFAVRLPVARAVYIVEARAAGFLPDRKEVEFSSDERQDVVLHLKRP